MTGDQDCETGLKLIHNRPGPDTYRWLEASNCIFKKFCRHRETVRRGNESKGLLSAGVKLLCEDERVAFVMGDQL